MIKSDDAVEACWNDKVNVTDGPSVPVNCVPKLSIYPVIPGISVSVVPPTISGKSVVNMAYFGTSYALFAEVKGISGRSVS